MRSFHLSLVIINFETLFTIGQSKESFSSFIQVSYSLLVFFCGMFITVDGFNRTGIPSAIWDFMEPYSQVDHIGGVAVLSLVILVLSNVASNVPTST